MKDANFNEQSYQKQLKNKMLLVNKTFPEIHSNDIDLFSSDFINFRMRAEFRIWHEGNVAHYIMFDKNTKKKYFVECFLPGSKVINKAMPLLMSIINKQQILKSKIFQIDFLSTTNDELLITLIYHKKLCENWIEAAEALKHELSQNIPHIDIIGRSKKQKIIIDKDFVTETFNILNKKFSYKQIENSFTQPNAKIAEKMISWVKQNTKKFNNDLLELYCGNGNFSIALADNFKNVLATEISKSSVNAAHFNTEQNLVQNLKIVRLSAEEFTEAINKKREFNRLKQCNIELEEYNFQTVLVDPPRAGLDKNTCQMIASFNNIIYISCNPKTLRENLDTLLKTHKIEKFSVFDQFPYTEHIECGVILTKLD